MASAGLKKQDNYIRDISNPDGIAWSVRGVGDYVYAHAPTIARMLRDGYVTMHDPKNELPILEELAEIGKLVSEGTTLAEIYPKLAHATNAAKDALRIGLATQKYLDLIKGA